LKYFQLNSSLNSGVLDARLSVRLDVKQYMKGVAQGDNVLCMPQGGMRRRDGLRYVARYAMPMRPVPFIFNAQQRYVLAFYENAIDVYRDDVFKATIATTYLTSELADIRYAHSGDTLILVHENHAPALFQRQGDDVTWTLTDVGFIEPPQHNFNDANSPAGADDVQGVDFNGFTSGQLFKLNVGGIDTEDIAYAGDAAEADNANQMQLSIVALPNVAHETVTVAGNGGSTGVYNITMGGDNQDDWPAHTGRATSGSSSADIYTDTPGQTHGVSKKEDAWSALRGWPRTIGFHEGRLWFGGSTSLPTTLWGSNVNDFFNFDLGKSRVDNAIYRTLDVGQFDAITGIVSNRVLQVFTGGAEFVITQSPITPENIAVRRQESYGSRFVDPVTIDEATMYLQRTGRTLRELILGDVENEYRSQTTSILAPVLINDPVDMAISVGTDQEDANYVLVVNADGTIAAFNTLRSQLVAAWTKLETNGAYHAISSVMDDMYFSVNRGTDYYLCVSDPDALLDQSVLYDAPNSATLSGLDHLEGDDVSVWADGAYMGVFSVAGGEVTLPRIAVDSAEAGLAYIATIKSMPIENNLGAGFDLDASKRIVKATVWLENTLGLVIDGHTVSFRNFGESVLDQPATPYTGKKSMNLMGYSKTLQVTLSQNDPTPMTVLGFSLEMEQS